MMYAEYLTIIRNNAKLGKTYGDKAEKVSFGAKSNHDSNLSSDILFSDDVVVIHISGNRESSGRIVKTSTGLKKCFGYDKAEIMGKNICELMSNLFAQKHNAFLE